MDHAAAVALGKLIKEGLESIATSIDEHRDAMERLEIGVEAPTLTDRIGDVADSINSIGEG